jgi:hypothetical protein
LDLAAMSNAPSLASGQVGSAFSQPHEQFKPGRLEKALELLDPLTAADPDPKSVEYLRGLVLYQQGSLELAATHLQKRLPRTPPISRP